MKPVSQPRPVRTEGQHSGCKQQQRPQGAEAGLEEQRRLAWRRRLSPLRPRWCLTAKVLKVNIRRIDHLFDGIGPAERKRLARLDLSDGHAARRDHGEGEKAVVDFDLLRALLPPAVERSLADRPRLGCGRQNSNTRPSVVGCSERSSKSCGPHCRGRSAARWSPNSLCGNSRSRS